MESVHHHELTPAGVEVSVDLSRDHPKEVIVELNGLYSKYHLLVFRNQCLSRERQFHVTTWFGSTLPLSDLGSGYISNSRPDGNLGSAEIKFHSDQAHCPIPLDGIMLHAIELEGGDSITRFVDTTAAYRSLPSDMKRRIEGLHAVHVMSYDDDRNNYVLDPEMSHYAHPIVRKDTRTGDPCLYVTEEWTRSIVELPGREGLALLKKLLAHILRPESIYDHVWQQGDVVLWNNQAMLHARTSIKHMRRTLQRTQLGERGLLEQRPELSERALAPLKQRLTQGSGWRD